MFRKLLIPTNDTFFAGDEGFVHVSNSFHDLGTDDGMGNEVLLPAHYSWNNAVAVVTIRRIYVSH